MAHRPDMREIIDRHTVSRFQRLVFLLCGATLVLDGFDTQSIGFLAPAVAASLHVSLTSFGPVFGAALLGLMISSFCAGPIADRVGRRWPTILSVVLFASFTGITAHAASLHQLVLFRFITGLGLGGAMPNVVALSAEYSPKRLQQAVVTTIFCGMPLGALLGGLLSATILSLWGWRFVFYIGGLLPLLLSAVLIPSLPESILFLGLRDPGDRRVVSVLKKIAPDIRSEDVDLSGAAAERPKRVPAMALFTEGRASGTLLLWVPFFMNLLVLYFIVSWLPALLRQASTPVSAGILAVSLFSLGGILGSLLQGRWMIRWGGLRVLLVEFGLTAILMAVLAFGARLTAVMATTFLLGCVVQGAQAGLNALAARCYPTSIRATGVGWALGAGRLGSIAGPWLAGLMLLRGWSGRQILLAGIVPALLSAFALLVSHVFHGLRPESSGVGAA